jgi:hypothetical protein
MFSTLTVFTVLCEVVKVPEVLCKILVNTSLLP